MSSEKPPRGSPLLHPVGDKDPSTYWRRRALAGAVIISILAVFAGGAITIIRSEAPALPSAREVASPSSTASSGTSMAPLPIPSPTSTTGKAGKKDKKKDPEPSWTPVPGAPGQDGNWADYPWGSDGLECPAPKESPAAQKAPTDPGVVVVLGDSLIRDSRDSIASSLANYGMSAQFVCWGGKNLEWGLAQIETLRAMNLLPTCLVINLGTNDLKGTTANGLADAVPLTTVGDRLEQLLLGAADITHVFAVDIAADLALAPSTMADVGQAPQVWEDAVRSTGVGEVIPWSSSATANAGLIGSDGIHDSASGRQVRAGMIADAVAPYCAP